MERAMKNLARDLTDANSSGVIVGSQEVNLLNTSIFLKRGRLVIEKGDGKVFLFLFTLHMPSAGFVLPCSS